MPSGAQLPKDTSRPLIDAVVGLSMDVEQRAQIITDAAGHLLAGNDNELPRRLRGLFDGQHPPDNIVDMVVDGVERATVPGTASDGEAAELLLNLSSPWVQVGARGVRALRRLMADERQDRTRAVAAWVLADAADTVAPSLNSVDVGVRSPGSTSAQRPVCPPTGRGYR